MVKKGKNIKFSGNELVNIFAFMLCVVLAVTFVLYPYFDVSISMLYLIICMLIGMHRHSSSQNKIERRLAIPLLAAAAIYGLIVLIFGIFTPRAVLLVIVLMALLLTNEATIRFKGDLKLTS
ncbi:MAG: hypothetical protein WC788_05580 [Candidatus Paceibacterota bacterium]|jgi:hypothetical protein